MTKERQVIIDLVELVDAWMNGVMKQRLGIIWAQPPPALQRARAYLDEEPIPETTIGYYDATK